MSIPITGILMLPLGFLIALMPWRFCLIGLMSFAMMSPAAVVNFGHLGLQPGYYLSILLTVRAGISLMIRGFTLNAYVIGRMKPLLYCIPWTLVVLFIACCFFQGQVETLRGTAGYKSGLTTPFHLSRENYTQLAYLVCNICLVYVLGQEGARQSFDALVRDWDQAMSIGLCFAAFVCVWQFAALYGGIWFPSDFFYSNAGYSKSEAQSMVGLFRINGPCEEPSTLGYVFTGYLLYAWRRYQIHPTAFSVGLIAASIFCMVVSTSTTAFFGLFLVSCLAVWDLFSERLYLLTRDFRLTSGQLAAIGIVIVAVLGGGLVAAAYWQQIYLILQATVLHKTHTSSFQQRVFADMLGLRIFVDTYGMGVGLGSHKANSLAITLLSNVGFVGFCLFVAGAYNFFRPENVDSRDTRHILGTALRPFQSGVLGLLLIHTFSNPNLSYVCLWAEMGGVVAIMACARSSQSNAGAKIRPARDPKPVRSTYVEIFR